MKTIMLAAIVAAGNVVADVSPIIVEASRLDQSPKEIPSHVEVISRREIDSSGARNTVELLEKRANLFIRKLNSNPAQAQMSMRGYGANGFGRVKILVDGEELNNPDMSPQNLIRIPIRSIQRVEILHGPQTVLHGSDASAGVINIISDSDSYDAKTELEAHGGNLGAGGAHIGTRGGMEEDGITYYADLDYDRADGWRKNSQYELWSLKSGMKQRFDDGSLWSLKVFYAYSAYGLPGGIFTGETYGDWQSRAREADDTSSNARNDAYGINIAGKDVFDNENSLRGEFAFRERRSESYDYIDYLVDSFSYKLKYENASPLFEFDNQFDMGADLKHDIIDADAYNSAMHTGGDNDFTRFSTALFAREEFWLLDELSVFGGTRSEWFHSRDKYDIRTSTGTESNTKRSLAVEAGLKWCPDDDTKAFAKWTSFYHAPLADELFSAYGVPNMELNPEEGQNVEIGLDWTFLNDFNFNVTGFHTELKNEIMYLNFANRNATDKTARTGFETSFAWFRDKVGSAGVMYAYVYSRFTEGEYKGNDVPMIPRQQLRAFGEYYVTDEFAVNGGYRFIGQQRYGGDFGNEGGYLPTAGIFDIGFRILPSKQGQEGLKFAFTVDNLFDKRYCDYGEYFGSHYVYPASGRTFMFSVLYEY